MEGFFHASLREIGGQVGRIFSVSQSDTSPDRGNWGRRKLRTLPGWREKKKSGAAGECTYDEEINQLPWLGVMGCRTAYNFTMKVSLIRGERKPEWKKD